VNETGCFFKPGSVGREGSLEGRHQWSKDVAPLPGSVHQAIQ